MKKLRLAPSARRDLAAIWTYTAEAWGVDQAEGYITALHNDMDRLRHFPEQGPPHATRHGNFRKLPSGHHLVFYWVGGEAIEIVRVLHERMDVGGWLGK